MDAPRSVSFTKARGMCYFNTIKAFVYFLPSKAVDEESDGEGAEDATDGEDRDGDGPDSCEGALGDGLLVALGPCLVDEVFDDLPKGKKKKKVECIFL